MTTVDKVTRLTSQLVGDISRLPGVQLDGAGEAQLVQLLTDAMEAVGHIALEDTQTDSADRCNLANCAIGYPHAHRTEGVYPINICF